MIPDDDIEEKTRAVQEKLMEHVSIAMFIPPYPSSPDEVFTNGTVSFLETPKGKFVVTNYHVWEGFCEKRMEVPGARLAVGGRGLCQPIDISDSVLVGFHSGADLAVLRFPENDLIESIGKKFYRPENWPIGTCEEDDDIVLCGFPGNLRQAVGPLSTSESVLLVMKIQSVSDRKYRLYFKNQDPELIKYGNREIKLAEFPWGGMSGSMVYLINKENKLEVVGFFNAAGVGVNGCFYASRADAINSDGSISL